MEESHYASSAYNSTDIPQQSASAARTWLGKFAKTRLPWGRTQEIAPESILQDPTPKSLRFWEAFDKKKAEEKALGTYKPRPFEGVDTHGVLDHERFRHARLSKRLHFWMLMCGGGRVLFYLNIVLSIFTYLMPVSALGEPWLKTGIDTAPFFVYLLGVPLFCWGLGSLVINKLPRLWFKPGGGKN